MFSKDSDGSKGHFKDFPRTRSQVIRTFDNTDAPTKNENFAHSVMGKNLSQWMHNIIKLEQLERLRSEDTPRRTMITHTIEQFILNPKSILMTS